MDFSNVVFELTTTTVDKVKTGYFIHNGHNLQHSTNHTDKPTLDNGPALVVLAETLIDFATFAPYTVLTLKDKDGVNAKVTVRNRVAKFINVYVSELPFSG